MNILAIDASTPRCSAAALHDGAVLAETDWEDTALDHQRLFQALPALCVRAGLGPAEFECLAVNSGPGRFTGLRTAMAAAMGMALPGERPVVGIDSGSVIAWQVWRGGLAGPVVVAGDARRNRLWMARFEDGAGGPRFLADYTSFQVQDAAGFLRNGDRLVSSDWGTIGTLLESLADQSGAVVVPEPCRPHARTVGHLADLKLASGELTRPAIVYLHPPV